MNLKRRLEYVEFLDKIIGPMRRGENPDILKLIREYKHLMDLGLIDTMRETAKKLRSRNEPYDQNEANFLDELANGLEPRIRKTLQERSSKQSQNQTKLNFSKPSKYTDFVTKIIEGAQKGKLQDLLDVSKGNEHLMDSGLIEAMREAVEMLKQKNGPGDQRIAGFLSVLISQLGPNLKGIPKGQGPNPALAKELHQATSDYASDELRAANVNRLVQMKDWAGLVRYGLAHEDSDAVEEALNIAKQLKADRKYALLVDLLENLKGRFWETDLRSSKELLELHSGRDRQTLEIIDLFPRAASCFLAGGKAVHLMESQHFLSAASAADKAFELSVKIGDWALAGFFANAEAEAQRHRGELVEAVKAYSVAAEIYRKLANNHPEVYVRYRAGTLLNLGNVQTDLDDFNGAHSNFKAALDAFLKLEQSEPNEHQASIAIARNNLGNVHRCLGQLEDAKRVLELALEVRQKLARDQSDQHLAWLASTLNNLGSVHRDLGNLPLARSFVEKALEIRKGLAKKDPHAYQFWVTRTFNDLSVLLTKMGDSEGAQAASRDAMNLAGERAANQPISYNPEIAMSRSTLGAVALQNGDLESAETHLEEGLKAWLELAKTNPGFCNPRVAINRLHLAELHLALGNIPAAWAHLESAKEFYTQETAHQPSAYLQERIQLGTLLGKLQRQRGLLSEQPDLIGARATLREARDQIERARARFENQETRRRVQSNAARIYELLAQTCVDLWDESIAHGNPDLAFLREALEVAEAGRARQLLDLLAEETLLPRNAPEDLVEQFRDLRRRVRAAQAQLQRGETPSEHSRPTFGSQSDGQSSRSPSQTGANHPNQSKMSEPNYTHTHEEVERLYHEQESLLARVRNYDAEFNPDQPFPPATLEQLSATLGSDKQTAFVQFTLAGDSAWALVIAGGGLFPVRLPGLSRSRANQLANNWFKNYSARRTSETRAHVIRPQRRSFFGRMLSGLFVTAKPTNLEKWATTIPKFLEPVSQMAIQPIVKALENSGVTRLVISPHGALHIFPLHACQLNDGRHLADKFEVTYTPSLSLLKICAGRRRESPRDLLLAHNPTRDLPFTEVEGKTVGRRFHPNGRVLRHAEVHKEALMAHSKKCGVWHYSGHSFFHSGDPLQSALVLGGTDETFAHNWLNLRDIFTNLNLRSTTLAILNGCESGLLRPERADDYVNLPIGFLHAGATCVISTLWAVNDLSSALLMDKFHTSWRDEKGLVTRSPSSALREAQRWLRDDIKSGSQLVKNILPPLLEQIQEPEVREFCEAHAREIERFYPDSPPFASPVHWAPFACHGLGYLSPSTISKA